MDSLAGDPWIILANPVTPRKSCLSYRTGNSPHCVFEYCFVFTWKIWVSVWRIGDGFSKCMSLTAIFRRWTIQVFYTICHAIPFKPDVDRQEPRHNDESYLVMNDGLIRRESDEMNPVWEYGKWKVMWNDLKAFKELWEFVRIYLQICYGLRRLTVISLQIIDLNMNLCGL